ncbi:MAG: DUF4239 domain-containing protein [Notoacmeibacter sp.]|nr:DUF4239 domain-containing protein [Notoacmeibacter sp.]
MSTRSTFRIYEHYAYGAVAVVGTFAAIALLGWLMTTAAWAAWAPQMAGISGPFMNIVGILFGLTVVFLANDTWTAHDRARGAVLREADSIRGLDILAEAAPKNLRADLRAAVQAYAAAAIAEWEALAHCRTSPAAAAASDDLLRRFSRLPAEMAPLQQAMLGLVAQIREHRDVRIGLSRTHVNPLKWLGMAFLGFLTLLTVAVIHAETPASALIAMGLFGLAAAPTAAIVLIHGNPFQRPSAVTPDRLRDALAGRD